MHNENGVSSFSFYKILLSLTYFQIIPIHDTPNPSLKSFRKTWLQSFSQPCRTYDSTFIDQRSG